MNHSEKGTLRRRKKAPESNKRSLSDSEIDTMISSVNYVADTPEIDLTEDMSISMNFANDMYQQGKSMIIDLTKIKPDNPFYTENGLCNE
jgi:hypothetical protein